MASTVQLVQQSDCTKNRALQKLKRNRASLVAAWLSNYHWRSAPPIERLERDLDALRTTVIQLRHDLTSKANYAAKLEVLLRSRTARMDDLRSKIDQLREQNRRLDAEAERLVQIIRLG